MDATSTIFLVVIVIAGGPLALFADWLGRRLGKKRHSLFGLRPRHTASLLTFLAGVFIPLLAILAMLALSKDVRQWVIEGRRALQEKQNLEQQNGNLDREILQKNQQYDDLSKRNVQEQKLYNEARKSADKLQESVKGLNKKLAGLNKQFETQRQKLVAEEQQMRKLGAELREKSISVNQAKADLAKIQRDRATLQANFKKLQSDYKALDTDRTILDRENQALSAANKILGPQVDALKAQKATLQTELDNVHRNLDEARRQRDKAQDDYNALNAELIVLYRQANQLIGPSRLEDLIFHRGEELVRVPIDGDLSAFQAGRMVDILMQKARETALGRGAQSHEGSGVVGFSPVTEGNPMTPLEVQSALTRAITSQNQPLVLIAMTPINIFRTESVLVQVKVMPNPLVYRRGQAIASTQIDGRQDQEAIIQQLRIFLSEKVTQQAVSDQMIPRQGQDTPLGEVTVRQMLEVVQAIRNEAKPVKVSIVAKKDIHAADALEIEFRVGR